MALVLDNTVGPWEQVGNYGPDPFFATGSTTYTSPSFTASANTLLVVGWAGSGAANHTVSSIANSGTPLTWTRLIRRTASAAYGEVNEELWYALNPSAQTITYTLTWTEATSNYTGHGRGYLWSFTGHNQATPFSDSDLYLGTYGATKPVSATALTQAEGGVVVGVFTDGGGSATLSSANADTTGGVVNGAGAQNVGFYKRGISDSLAAGSFSPSLNTTNATWQFSSVFGVIQPASGAPAGMRRGPGIGRY